MRSWLLAAVAAFGGGGALVAQTEPLLQLQGQPYSQGSMTLHFSASVGAPAYVFYGLNPLDPPLQTNKGPFYVGSVANAVFIGSIPAGGRLDVSFVMPPLSPVLAGVPLAMQGFVPGALTNPATLPLDQPHYVPAEATILVSPNPTVVGAFGDRVATGDLNGDEKLDVVVGAWWEDAGGADRAGRVYVFWGPDLKTVLTLEPPAPLNWGLFGNGLYVADFDGDGVEDLVVSEGIGEPPPPTAPGHLYFYGGGPSFPAVPQASTASLDVGVAYSSFGHFGTTGDMTGDGAPDLIVGTPQMDVNGVEDAGRLEIHRGRGFASSFSLLAPDFSEDGHFGQELATGDINGDNMPDLVVGAPRKYLNGIPSMGRVYAYTGPGPVHFKTINHPDPDGLNSRFGNAIVAHDMNHDGLDDIIATDQRNHAYIFWAPDFDSFTRIHRPPDPATGTAISVSFGYFAAAGDVNGDDWQDVVIGEPFASGQGRVYAALGPYFATFRVLSDKLPEAGGEFGWGVYLRDIDGDGRQELLVGSDLADPGGVSGAGRVTVFDFGF